MIQDKAATALEAVLHVRRQPERTHFQAFRTLAAILDGVGAHNSSLRGLVEAVAPHLLDQPGVGPVTAAQIYIAWSHPGRCRNEAAFARLAGVAPLEASSGQNTRHRLNRRGDRQLNRALHTQPSPAAATAPTPRPTSPNQHLTNIEASFPRSLYRSHALSSPSAALLSSVSSPSASGIG